MSVKGLLILAVCAGAPGVPRAHSAYDLPIKEHVFPNGLRLLVIERPRDHRVSAKIFTDMGALNETPGDYGAAHFLEHLLFKGTPTVGSTDWQKEKPLHDQIDATEELLIEELNRSRNDLSQRGIIDDYRHRATTPRIEELRSHIRTLSAEAARYADRGPTRAWYQGRGGTRFTANTEQEYMFFTVDLPADRVDLFMEIEADRMQNAVFREFDEERMIVLEQRYGDLDRVTTPFREAMNALVGTTSMVYAPEGFLTDFGQYTRKYQRDLYRRYFVPNNTTLILVGGVTIEQLIPIVDRHFGHMPRQAEPPRYKGVEPVPRGEKRLIWRDDGVPPRIEIRHQIPGVGHPDRPHFDVLAEAVTRRLQSVLRGTGSSASVAWNTRVVHATRFGVPASLNLEVVLDGAGADETEAVLVRTLARLATESLDPGLIELAQKTLRTNWLRTAADTNRLTREIGLFQTMDSWRTLQPYLETRDRTTPADVRRLIGQYLVVDNRSIGVVRPRETSH